MKHKHLLIIALSAILSACSSQKSPVAAAGGGDQSNIPVKTASDTPQKTKDNGKLANSGSSGTQKEAKPVEEKPFVPPAPQIPGSRVSRVSVPTKTVALTFDDGPHGTHTPRILNILAKYNAKCTFFVLGSNVQTHPGIVKRIVNEGHEVGNHSWNHPSLAKSSRQTIASQLTRTNDSIVSACGRKPVVMRPPYGAADTALCSWMKQDFGLTSNLWDVDTNDWRKPGVAAIVARAVNGARPGSIILVHDIHGSTADAVEGIVQGLQNRGFELVTVSELLRRGRQYAGQSPVAAMTAPGPVLPAPAPSNEQAAESQAAPAM